MNLCHTGGIMNAGYFTKNNLSELVKWFQVGETVTIHKRFSCGFLVGQDNIRRIGDDLICTHTVGCYFSEPRKWTPYNEQIAGQIAKKLMKNRQRRKAERDRLAKLDIQ